MNRVVVTGIGIVSSLGNNQQEVKDSLYNTKSGISFDEDQKKMGFRSCVSGQIKIDLEKSVKEFSGKNFSEFKENLIQVLVDKIFPLSLEIKKLLNEKGFLDQILVEGAQKANDIASKKIKEIHKIMGF